MKIIRIPQDRVGSMIGKKGEVKKYIEEQTGIIMEVDSETGEVTLYDEKVKSPLLTMKVEYIVRAIGRGFSPDNAYDLLDDEMYLEVLDMRDYAGKSPKHLRRIKARIIGQRGKTRRIIEQLTGSRLSIYGSSVSIISPIEGLEVARTAVDMLLGGSEHSMVYRYMERKRREKKMAHLDSFITGKETGPEPREEECPEDSEE